MVEGNASTVAIRVQGLTKRFGKVTALDGVDLEVAAGAAVGLLGTAGAGKSTILRILVGLARATSGSILVLGEPAGRRRGLPARRSIGFVDQGARFPAWMTGHEVVSLAAAAHGVPRKEIPERVDAAIDRTKLGAVASTRVGGWPASGRAWLGLAQAMVAEPAILLLDAPFDALEAEDRARLTAALRDRRSSAVLVATRRVEDVAGLCDRLVVLRDGRVASEGPTPDVLAGLGPTTYALDLAPGSGLAVAGLAARLRAERWVTGVVEDGATLRVAVSDDARAGRALIPMVVATGVAIDAISRRLPSLPE